MSTEQQFLSLNIAVLTVSDSRTEADDTSGKVLVERLKKAGHQLAEKAIVRDDIYAIRGVVSRWIADPEIHVVVSTGGTGVTGRDGTPEAFEVLFDKKLDGFGEIFRAVSYAEIKTSAIQSRAIGGVANGTYLFCLPGSSGACITGWDKLIKDQLDLTIGPCNLAMLIPRLKES